MKRIIACALALCLSLGLMVGAASAASREDVLQWRTPLGSKVDLTEITSVEKTASGYKNLLQQNVLTYEPNLTVSPMVIYGSTLYGRST